MGYFFIVIGVIIAVVAIGVIVSSSANSPSNQTLTNSVGNARSDLSQVSSVLSNDHPAVMLYKLTKQCFPSEDAVLVQCAKDIVREAEQQYKIGDRFREKIKAFYIDRPGYQHRLKTHIVKFEDKLYALSFILEVICISRSDLARKMLIRSNFVYQNRAGDLVTLPFINYEQEQLNTMDVDEKEKLLFDIINKISLQLDDVDFCFIKHIESVLSDINNYYSELCINFKGYDDFSNNESQFPAMACYIDTYVMAHNYRYNYSKELSTTYRCYFEENKDYNLRISITLETLDCYIEMCTRYKVFMTITHGYYKAYTRKYESLNGSNVRNKIKEAFGDIYVEAIDKCLEVMGSSK